MIGPLPDVTALTVFPFYDREFGYLNGPDTTSGYGGMRTEVHVYPKTTLARPDSNAPATLTGGEDASTVGLDGAKKDNFTNASGTWTYADGSPIVQAFPGKHYPQI